MQVINAAFEVLRWRFWVMWSLLWNWRACWMLNCVPVFLLVWWSGLESSLLEMPMGEAVTDFGVRCVATIEVKSLVSWMWTITASVVKIWFWYGKNHSLSFICHTFFVCELQTYHMSGWIQFHLCAQSKQTMNSFTMLCLHLAWS